MKRFPILVILLLLGVTISVVAEAPWAVKGTTTNHNVPSFVRSYPVLSSSDPNVQTATKTWRVVNGTGNCCENHISVGPTGRIIDSGGAVPLFSDDEGKTWKRFGGVGLVLLGAEGSGSYAPNGDWVGVTWDPYTGDRVVTFKWVAAENAWYSSHVALHSPAYDRPFVGVIPGPITVEGQTFPYAVLMRGGAGAKQSYLSLDGLTYALVSPGETAFVAREPAWLNQPAKAWADWVQPIASAKVVPLPGGGAIAAPDRLCAWMRVDVDLGMNCWGFPNATTFPGGSAPRFDSLGRLHLFEPNPGKIVHRMSSDGGASWKTLDLPLPRNTSYQSSQVDSAVNGQLDMAVVGIRADVWRAEGPTTKILIYKITNLSAATPTVKIYQVGNGDRLFGSGLNSPYARMDFMTLGLLPDGRVVTTFGDWIHSTPRVAVEQ